MVWKEDIKISTAIDEIKGIFLEDKPKEEECDHNFKCYDYGRFCDKCGTSKRKSTPPKPQLPTEMQYPWNETDRKTYTLAHPTPREIVETFNAIIRYLKEKDSPTS